MGTNQNNSVTKSSYARLKKLDEAVAEESRQLVQEEDINIEKELQEIINSNLERSLKQESEEIVSPISEDIVVQSVEGAGEKPAVLIDTLWFGLDYGSILTAYALDKAVEDMGCDPVLMNKSPDLWTNHYTDPTNIAGSFIYKNCKVAKILPDKKSETEFAKNADAVIVGSDVVWNYDVCTKATKTRFFLDYAPASAKKISCASSFGYQYSGPYGEDLKKCAKYLKRFDHLSVCDYSNLDMLRSRFGLDAEVLLDPVFLCDKSWFEKAASESPGQHDETDDTFIFSYIKAGNRRKRELILRGNDILTPNNYSPMRNFININIYPESKKMLGLDVAYHIKVEDWLYYISHSEFVITDDYYGVCFALIFNKPFIFVESVNYDGMNHVSSLLSALGLEERILSLEDDFKKKEYLFRLPIRYKKVNKILDSMIEQSRSWLRSVLPVQKTEVEGE